MHLDETSKAAPDATRKRYEAIDAVTSKLRTQGAQ
jgi:hypothetical protein